MTSTGSWKERLDIFATMLLIAAAAAVLWTTLSRRGGSGTPVREIPKEPVSLADSNLIGDAAAPVGILLYTDFECPFCKKFATETFPEIERSYIAPGKAFLAVKHYPLTNIHPLAQRASEIAECAEAQGKFRPVHDGIFSLPQPLTEDALTQQVAKAGLDKGGFETCLASASAAVQRDIETAKALKVNGTPAFLIGKREPDGRLRVTDFLVGAAPYAEFQRILENLSR